MSKRLKRNLATQIRDLDKEIYTLIFQINFLNSDQKELEYFKDEIISKTFQLRDDISRATIAKEKLVFWMDLLNKKKGNNYDASILPEYPLLATKMVHTN